MNTNTLLYILQQSEYNLQQFAGWYQQHQSDQLKLEPEKWTLKLKLVYGLASLFFFLPVVTRFSLAVKLIRPVENIVRLIIYTLASFKLRFLRLLGLKVVAIAGSYGKTSTKHIIYHALKNELACLMTPKSVNTPLGISLVILTQLKPRHRLFIVEFGEFKPGDVAQFSRFLQPDYVVLTPIGRQHLATFGSLEQIATNFGSLIHQLKDRTKLLAAAENQALYPNSPLQTYGLSASSQYRATQIKVSRAGSEYLVSSPANRLSLPRIFMPLYGEHQAANSLPAFWLAKQLGLDPQKVVTRLATIPYIKHRHQPYFGQHDVLILDNGYNSNPDSIGASLKLLNQLKPTHRVVITMGFVELGSNAKKIHFELGQQLAKNVDFVGLIEAPDTAEIIAGFISQGGKKSHLVVGHSQQAVMHQLQDKIIPGSVILFENGVNEIYR